jgi:hypothetical protein
VSTRISDTKKRTDLGGIASEGSNVVLNPRQCYPLIMQTEIQSTARPGFCAQRKLMHAL